MEEFMKNYVKEFMKENKISTNEKFLIKEHPDIEFYIDDLFKLKSEIFGKVTTNSSIFQKLMCGQYTILMNHVEELKLNKKEIMMNCKFHINLLEGHPFVRADICNKDGKAYNSGKLVTGCNGCNPIIGCEEYAKNQE
jgi:hypothetical protein